MNIFEKIIGCRSLTAIGWMVEDALNEPLEHNVRCQIVRIEKELNRGREGQLDEVYALAHEGVGNHEEAAKLREFMAKKAKQKAA